MQSLQNAMDWGAGALFAQAEGYWLPPPDSTFAETVDPLFWFIFWVSAFFFVLIVALMVAFVALYRRRPGYQPGPSPHHNTPLEITWTLIPLAIVLVIFYWGFVGYMEMTIPEANAYEINVKARQWSWTFKYANGYVDGNLHVPVDRPVRLVMTSEDVIHSLWIPDFRVKMDLVPGRYTTAWFRAKRAGQHDLYCAEYCGTKHSTMSAAVVVHEPGEFEVWLKDAAAFAENLSPAERGELLYRTRGCRDCHSIDGTAKTGPSFQGIYGQTHTFSNASPTPVDENYIRESILDPSAKVREGYRDQMNSYKGQLSDDEIDELIAYIKSLKQEQPAKDP